MFPSRPVRAALGALIAATPTVLAAQSVSLDKLQIHGYLTQGYAEASSLGFSGIPTDATGDYRTAALQFRYGITDKDNMVVQLRHRRLGSSILQTVEPDVALNWAFYQHRWGNTSAKVGKLPIPHGIYSEVRSVGTLLPFFRAPVNTYVEGYETIDGALASSTLDLGKSWSLETAAYAGGFDFSLPIALPPTNKVQVLKLRMERSYGAQTWLNTPIQGLRVGLAGMRFRARKMTDTSTTPYSSKWATSLDGNFGRVLTRGEYTHVAAAGTHIIQYWGQVGVKVTDKLGVYAQNDVSNNRIGTGRPGTYIHTTGARDLGASANYALSEGMLVKFEQHRVTGYGFDTPIPLTGPAGKANYFIASVSASF